MAKNINVFWFRRDLRITDNHALYQALKEKKEVLLIFIFDLTILKKLPENDARVSFIHERLHEIQKLLKENYNSSIALFYGKPAEIFNKLTKNYTIETVYTNHDYEPYAITRDKEIKLLLESKKIDFKTFKDQVIFERNDIVKKDNTPYKVYTPYSKIWLHKIKEESIRFFPSETLLNNTIKSKTLPNLSLKDIGFVNSNIKIEDYKISPTLIANYEATRNFPAQDKTSKLSPHLRFGTISIRNIVQQALQQQNNTFLKELIWREFFMQIMWHFPHTVKQCFKPKYERIEWRNNETEFKAWCDGKTGYPLVDAGMRQLNKTGFMHNRVRMLVGSFLCKHLLVDWRLGEAYFALKLNDYELSSNIGNWQWVAGCGVDAAPYFRIFNPTTQIKKFDNTLSYIKKWVPEFQELTYTTPIVDHKMARERCLKVYKAALQ